MSLSQTLESYLSEHGAHYTLEHHAFSLTSLDTARAAHVDEDNLAKSVVLEDEGGLVLAVLPASRRLELGRLRDELGRSLHLLPEAEMGRLFPDCELGAVPPLGAAYGLPTVVDTSLEGRDVVFFEGGDHETLVAMDGSEFLDLLEGASVAEFAAESHNLRSALRVRERLYDALLEVGRAIGAPLASGTRWQRRLRRALQRLSVAFDQHVEESESPEGLLDEIALQSPRLARYVEGLRDEHAELREDCARLLADVEGAKPSLSLRKEVHELIVRLEHHRHRGADLVYDAFGVDIGGG